MKQSSENWGSRVGLILAMAGNAVGLGNFLRFPVQAVQNGGGTFIIPYLVCFLVMGIPLLWIEWSIGRLGGRFGHHATPFMMARLSKAKYWKYIGVFGIFTNIAVAAYYCYIESWTLAYVFHSIGQTFAPLSQTEVALFFDRYVDYAATTTGIPYEAVVFYILCLLLNTWILSKGLSGGIEKVAKIGMPLLLIFGAFLAIKGLTLGTSAAPAGCADCNGYLGLNFLWEPQFSSLLDPQVWMAAAGQIFFTLSVGMGTIHCYAAFLRSNDDVALNALSAGWVNGFVEIVLGASILIPISVGYLGLDWVVENASFAMGFKTMPFLFAQWGPLMGTLAGVAWFGLLFFAGITSSLAMGTPWISFLQDEFQWKRVNAAWSFGLILLIVGLPTVFFYQQGVFAEYDYWAGTLSLVLFALAETILFVWVFGMHKAWKEINHGAEIRIPNLYKPILKFVTPTLLLVIFVSSLIMPVNNDWRAAWQGDWVFDNESVIGKLKNQQFVANREYFSSVFESETEGQVMDVIEIPNKQVVVEVGQIKRYLRNEKGKVVEAKQEMPKGIYFDSITLVKAYTFDNQEEILVRPQQEVQIGSPIAQGDFIHSIFYIDMARLLLVLVFVGIAILVFIASKNQSVKR
ncbi:sodium-dependent transporter [Cytophagales bacterium LB-30]|uniref:Sodium-dependent transporter n=1 Tax=Shiella aurantiaca TaxID=3058365 RepID=A0ABT8F2P3_9BACT|nr:sodium-dependent transporter [Shiella aurantiaca]MDN4164722.1 sodium-dependent transporter [Shiella aurantiaca]